MHIWPSLLLSPERQAAFASLWERHGEVVWLSLQSPSGRVNLNRVRLTPGLALLGLLMSLLQRVGKEGRGPCLMQHAPHVSDQWCPVCWRVRSDFEGPSWGKCTRGLNPNRWSVWGMGLQAQ